MLEFLLSWLKSLGWFGVFLSTLLVSGCAVSGSVGAFDMKTASKPADVWHADLALEGVTYSASLDGEALVEYLGDFTGTVVKTATGIFSPLP